MMQRKVTLPLSDAPINSILAEDIIDHYNQTLLAVGTILSPESINLLKNHNIQKVTLFQETRPKTTASSEMITSSNFNQELTDVLGNEVLVIFNASKDIEIKNDKITNIIRKVIDSLSHKKPLLHLIDTNDQQDELAQHHVNVSLFALTIGLAMGIPRDDLCILGVGSLLHDIGKTQVSLKSLNKPPKLTVSEYANSKDHVSFGYNILKQNLELDYRIPLMALQHHERCNGHGYPWGITESQIDPLAQILAIADVYESLTSNRSYRTRYSAEKAIKLINNSTGPFNKEVLRVFNNIVVPYNIGEDVQLSNGLTGKVIGLNSANLRKPKVFTSEGKYNLINEPKINIVSTIT